MELNGETNEWWYTVAEAREILGLSNTGIYKWMRRGSLPFVTVPGRWTMIPHSSLDAQFEENEKELLERRIAALLGFKVV